MSDPVALNPHIIEALYCEALVLSDEVRNAFALSGRMQTTGEEDLARIAFSCEALRTTTRMMHALAWLLNHRAYFKGEISHFQLSRNGRLAADTAAGNSPRLALLDPEIQELIEATERFYARLVRLDQSLRDTEPVFPNAITRLRTRLSGSLPFQETPSRA